ncbi:hypothetical protein R4144_00640 [Gordonia amicalis]|uniref:hypothetical protein n=1 Tax=Gordonia amicalis TaxID=89053 RepID=UPI002953BAB0|nr:hypothetical protein [Gordonia amicalis]MDV7171923.1 hypothetical protein [Gordonia amicalis]
MESLMGRDLSYRFSLRRIGDLQDVVLIEHGPVSWIDFPSSHLPDLYKLIRREIEQPATERDED